MTNILIFIAIYFIVLATMSVLATPYRNRIQTLGKELLSLDLTDSERSYVKGCMRHAYSWRSSVGLSLGYIAGLFETSDTLEARIQEARQTYPNLRKNWQIYALFEAYFVSVRAVNPLFGWLATFVRFLYRAKVRRHHNARQTREIVDLRGLSASV